MSDCKNYVSEEDIKALKESELHIEHVARSRNLVGEKVLSVTDTIRGEKVTNRTLDGLEELYQNALSNIGYQQMGDYKPGINITGRNQIVFENGSWYIYRGDLPHVTSGASLAEDGGIWSESNVRGKWVLLTYNSYDKYKYRTISLDYFVNDDGNFLQKASDWCKENRYALVIPKGKTYQYSERVIFEDITLLWEGTLELIQPIDCGIVFRRNVTMPTYGYLKTSKTIVLPDDYYMVGFYSWKSPDGSLGCQDNIISGRLDIRNGHIDYDGWDQGNVDDPANLTGGGVLMLGGSWLRPSLGVDESSWENVHRNDLKFYVDGFSYALTLQGIYDSESVNEIFGWVNGNAIDLRARRARDYISCLATSSNGNTRGGDVSSNVIIAELQSSKETFRRFLYCEGESNNFLVKGWDIKPNAGDILFEFSRGGKPANAYHEATLNKLEMFGATLPQGEGQLSQWVHEDVPGLNNIVNSSFQYKNILPEASPYAANARLSAGGYIRGVDNFLGNFALRPKFKTFVKRNGIDITGEISNINGMFDGNVSAATDITVKTLDDVISIELHMENTFHHFNLVGYTMKYTTGFTCDVNIKLVNYNDVDIYNVTTPIKSTMVTGSGQFLRVQKIIYTFSRFNKIGDLQIGELFAKCESHNTRRGVIGCGGGDLSGHLRFLTKEASPVITDQKTGQLWEIQAVDGVIKLVAYYP